MIGSLVAYLSQHDEIDFVVNIGICGYHPKYALNAPLIQVGHIRSGSNQKEEIPLLPFRFAPLGSFYSSEREVRSLEWILESYVDMESYGFVQAMKRFPSIPYILFKVPVDAIDSAVSLDSIQKWVETISDSISFQSFFESIETYLQKIPKRKTYENIRTYYRLTHAEYSIYEKLAISYEALFQKDIEEYILSSQGKDKKIFLQELESLIFPSLIWK